MESTLFDMKVNAAVKCFERYGPLGIRYAMAIHGITDAQVDEARRLWNDYINHRARMRGTYGHEAYGGQQKWPLSELEQLRKGGIGSEPR